MASYTVKAIAKLAGITVRTLHHYDAIGLLKPASLSAAGYRLYADADVERLQQILFFKELDFGLQAIQEILDRPGFDRKRALQQHREHLLDRKKRVDALIRTLDRTLEAMERGNPMKATELFEGFDAEAHREEASARWGKAEVDAADKRVAHYTKEDWAAFNAGQMEWRRQIAALMGRNAADSEVQALIGEWHRTLNERFYECSAARFRGLGDLYVEDPRFAAHYETVQTGLAQFIREGMHVFADRMETE